jgi:hypothetical protein
MRSHLRPAAAATSSTGIPGTLSRAPLVREAVAHPSRSPHVFLVRPAPCGDAPEVSTAGPSAYGICHNLVLRVLAAHPPIWAGAGEIVGGSCLGQLMGPDQRPGMLVPSRRRVSTEVS